jgi:hypothetical protein
MYWFDNPIMDDLDDELPKNSENADPKKRNENTI